ncbi:type II toxin-antitoxin system mRNA interferase toxin, RelE/StbE family [Acidithiobacillus thiooxidans]|uniref:type II toxin-antitoxin system mRNA interferase toxin, RelE/StbE family n=1 Tax=Acidithiobacillus thiooxidans TaxID=930 RepID=UPI0040382E3E
MTGLHHSGDWAGYRECHVKPDLLLIYRKSNTHTLKLARLELTQRAFQLSRCSGLQPNTACSQLTGVFGALGRILGKAPIITAWRRLKRLLLLVFIWIDHRIINPGVHIMGCVTVTLWRGWQPERSFE